MYYFERFSENRRILIADYRHGFYSVDIFEIKVHTSIQQLNAP